MKSTGYAFTFPLRGGEIGGTEPGVLLYNAFTSSLALLDRDEYEAYSAFCSEGRPIADAGLEEQLRRGGFLLDDGFDEKQELRLRMFGSRFQSSSLGLTIAPTSDCNFRCVYCYEKDRLRPSRMSEEVMERVVGLLLERAGGLRELSVTWYGGEPLLALDVIEKLSERFLDICVREHIGYSAGIITNGSLLTRQTVEKLNRLKVGFYQITVDGTKENHDRTRPLKGGGGTYELILSRLAQCRDLLPEVSLRINVDRGSIGAAGQIRAALRERGLEGKVRPYLGRITNDNDDPALRPLCLTGREFARCLPGFLDGGDDAGEAWLRSYPKVKGSFCGADRQNSYVIDSDGLLYKCWNDIGKKDMAVGSLLTGERLHPASAYADMAYDPTEEPGCSSCRCLPLCMGGCPSSRRAGGGEERCTAYRYELERFLRRAAEAVLCAGGRTVRAG